VGILKIRAVAFDIDGTLYANFRMYLHSLPSFLFHPRLVYHFGKVRKDIRIRPHTGEFREAQAKLLSLSMGIPEQRATRLIDQHLYHMWERSFRGIKPLSGVRDTLLFFKGKGLKLAALSDFPVKRKLKFLGLDDLMDHAFCSEETGHLKPHTAPFHHLIRLFELPPEQILYVGNSYRYDIEGAAAAGLLTGYYNPGKKDKGIADFEFSRYAELRRWVEKRLN
jgi:putative hydrolase of the HAD superfamily